MNTNTRISHIKTNKGISHIKTNKGITHKNTKHDLIQISEQGGNKLKSISDEWQAGPEILEKDLNFFLSLGNPWILILCQDEVELLFELILVFGHIFTEPKRVNFSQNSDDSTFLFLSMERILI